MVRKVRFKNEGKERLCACCREHFFPFWCFVKWWRINLYELSYSGASLPFFPPDSATEIKRLWKNPYSDIICDNCAILMKDLIDAADVGPAWSKRLGLAKSFRKSLAKLEKVHWMERKITQRRFWYFLERGLINPNDFVKHGGEGD